MSANHTPGPWKSPSKMINADGLYIADRTGNWDICTINYDHAPSLDEAAANATLIAAAPDMFEALQNAVYAEAVGDKIDWPEILDAIARATGK